MRLREYEQGSPHRTGYSVDRCVSSWVEVVCGTTWDLTREAVYQLVHRTRGRGRSVKDLEIGAVDELLVGVSVVRDKDKGEKFTLLEFSSSF